MPGRIQDVIRSSIIKLFETNIDVINLVLYQSVAESNFVPFEMSKIIRNIMIRHDERIVISIDNDTYEYGTSIFITSAKSEPFIYSYTDNNIGLVTSYKIRSLDDVFIPYKEWLRSLERKHGDDLWELVDDEDEVKLYKVMNEVNLRLRNPRIDLIIMDIKNAIYKYNSALKSLRGNDAIQHILDTICLKFKRLVYIKSEDNTPYSNKEVNDIKNLLEKDVSNLTTTITIELLNSTSKKGFGMKKRTRKSKSKSKKSKKTLRSRRK